MRIACLYMSRQLALGVPYAFVYPAKRYTHLPLTGTWAAEILRELASRGHETTYVRFETRHFLETRFSVAEVAAFHPAERIDVLYSCEYAPVRAALERSDVIMMRHDYPQYAGVFDGFDIGDRPVILILAGPRTDAVHFLPDCRRFTLLVNSEEERAHFTGLGLSTEIFRKPAIRLFYQRPEKPVPKTYDMVTVLWDSSQERKRFDLMLDSLSHLDRATDRTVRLALVGDMSPHDERIAELTRTLSRIEICRTDKLDRRATWRCVLASRLSVVTSRWDANPQVIVESLASDVPVACAADIAGGGFQITPHTGELFAPTARSLAGTVLSMLGRLDCYSPRAHCTTIEQAADQIERIAARSSTAVGPGMAPPRGIGAVLPPDHPPGIHPGNRVG